jgi:hypothetical protein
VVERDFPVTQTPDPRWPDPLTPDVTRKRKKALTGRLLDLSVAGELAVLGVQSGVLLELLVVGKESLCVVLVLVSHRCSESTLPVHVRVTAAPRLAETLTSIEKIASFAVNSVTGRKVVKKVAAWPIDDAAKRPPLVYQ